MLIEPHQSRCLAHTPKTPSEWCELRDECARAVQIRHDTPHDLANSVYLPRACKITGDRFLRAGPATDGVEN